MTTNPITYYKDDELAILFSNNPHVDFRYPCPGDTEEQQKDKLAKPFMNMDNLDVKIIYKNKHGETCQYCFTIPQYYTWDGASIPRVFWRLIGSKTDPKFMIASMVHDVLCENKEYVHNNRYLSTIVLEKLCKQGGTGPFRRWAIKHSVDNYQKLVGGWNA